MKDKNIHFQINTDDLFFKRVIRSIEDLDAWISKNGWAGYDPYDVKGTRIFIWALGLQNSNLIRKIFRKLIIGPLIIGEALFPRSFRFLFRIKPSVNAKGMALFARGYLQLFKVTQNKDYKQKAIQCLEWLELNRSPGYAEPCWGYPFDWRNPVRLIPANTPTSVGTAAACDAFWTAWQVLGETKYLDMCAGICRFFIDSLNIDHISEDVVCFSYTPIDSEHVHNANLMVAACLLRVGKEVGNTDWVELGLKAGQYALNEQQSNGVIHYLGAVDNYINPNHVDHYHSGFEIRSLYDILKSRGMDSYRNAVANYYSFYHESLIEAQGDFVIPKMYPHQKYPINIHSCAEALLLNATVAEDFPKARLLLKPLFEWIASNMQTKEGWFIYMRRKVFGLKIKAKIPYIRWGQAWMLLALSQVLLAIKTKKLL